MTYVVLAWFIISIILFIMAHFAIWARTDNHRPRWLSVIGFFVGVILTGVALVFSMGWSVPCNQYLIDPATLGTGKYKILGGYPVPEEKIYLFIDVPAHGPKVCYVPWVNGKDAQKILEALEFGGGEIGPPSGGDGLFGEIQIYGAPPTADGPPKEETDPPPFSLDNLHQ